MTLPQVIDEALRHGPVTIESDGEEQPTYTVWLQKGSIKISSTWYNVKGAITNLLKEL